MVTEVNFTAAVETIQRWMHEVKVQGVSVFEGAIYLDGAKRFESPSQAWWSVNDAEVADRSLDEAGYPRAIR